MLSDFFCLIVPKIFVGGTSLFQKRSGMEKMI